MESSSATRRTCWPRWANANAADALKWSRVGGSHRKSVPAADRLRRGSKPGARRERHQPYRRHVLAQRDRVRAKGAGDRVTLPLRRLPAIRPISAYVFLGWSRLPTCEEPHSARPVNRASRMMGNPGRCRLPPGAADVTYHNLQRLMFRSPRSSDCPVRFSRRRLRAARRSPAEATIAAIPEPIIEPTTTSPG